MMVMATTTKIDIDDVETDKVANIHHNDGDAVGKIKIKRL